MPTAQDETKSRKQELYDRVKFHTTQDLLRSISYHHNQRRSFLHSLQEEMMESDVRMEVLYKRLYVPIKRKRGRKKKMVTDPKTGHRTL